MRRRFEELLSERSHYEQKFIRDVAGELNSHGFPVEYVTDIRVENPFTDEAGYYRENHITMMINPLVYEGELCPSNYADITSIWEDSKGVINDNGSVVFRVGKIPYCELSQELFGLAEHYSTGSIIEHDREIVKLVDSLFHIQRESNNGETGSSSMGLESVTAYSIEELCYNHFVTVKRISDDELEICVDPIRFLHDENHCYVHFDYTIRADLKNMSLTLIDQYDPTFLPSPAVFPDLPFDEDGDWGADLELKI